MKGLPVLHHISFTASDPHHVARSLAEMLDAAIVRAPSPPFPAGSWFVCYGDSNGSFLEILPWGTVLDPGAKFGFGHDDNTRPRSGAHVLLSTPLSVENIRAVAEREGWRFELVDARLFKVVKVWVENAALVELLPPELMPAYTRTFGTAGLPSLDAKLRALEAGSLR
jgi:hypothetical protein